MNFPLHQLFFPRGTFSWLARVPTPGEMDYIAQFAQRNTDLFYSPARET